MRATTFCHWITTSQIPTAHRQALRKRISQPATVLMLYYPPTPREVTHTAYATAY